MTGPPMDCASARLVPVSAGRFDLDDYVDLLLRPDEAAVEEATRWGTYVCAHAYAAEAIRRGGTAPAAPPASSSCTRCPGRIRVPSTNVPFAVA